jgi:hypothetical protein
LNWRYARPAASWFDRPLRFFSNLGVVESILNQAEDFSLIA